MRSTNWIGDVMMSMPTIRALKSHLKDCHITVICRSNVQPLYFYTSYVDRLIAYDAQKGVKRLAGLIRLSRRIRGEGYDLAVCLQNAFEAALLFWLAKVPRRIGYAVDMRGWLLTDRIERASNYRELSEIEYYQRLLEPIGVRDIEVKNRLELDDLEIRLVKELLYIKGVNHKDRLIAIAPGAAYGTAKRWLTDRFAEVASRLTEQKDTKVILLGSKKEGELGTRIIELCQNKPIDLIGKTTLRETISIISLCSLLICNDSGLMHIAADLNVPLVVIFGPTIPSGTAPRGDNVQVLHKPSVIDCQPCKKRDCDREHECMKAISTDEVMEAALSLLD